MAAPYRCTVTIDGTKFNAVSTSIKIGTDKDKAGMAQMGSLTTEIRVWADFHDDQNLPFGSIKKFFDLANVVTRDKIKDIKIEFWKDEHRQDAICTLSFKGWISSWNVSSGGGSNHVLSVSIQPALDQQNYHDLQLGN